MATKKPAEAVAFEAKIPSINDKNTYRVPLKQWRKWHLAARRVFNYTYEYMLANGQSIMSHPKQKHMTPDQWKTICWNAAWVAADGCVEAIATTE